MSVKLLFHTSFEVSLKRAFSVKIYGSNFNFCHNHKNNNNQKLNAENVQEGSRGASGVSGESLKFCLHYKTRIRFVSSSITVATSFSEGAYGSYQTIVYQAQSKLYIKYTIYILYTIVYVYILQRPGRTMNRYVYQSLRLCAFHLT